MASGKVMEGVFAINKPTGISSAQVIRDLQRHFNPSPLFAPYIEQEKATRARESHNQRFRRKQKKVEVKIGHGGTLDPLATGVLITGIGKGTKSLQDFLLCTKEYECIILFGTTTDTYDRVGKVLRKAPYEHVTKELVEEKMSQFRGKFEQLPPLFSALKMDGKPLYEYAREGKPIPREIQRRPVEVLELEMLEWMEPGTHHHEAPSETAGHEEINVANKLWKQEGVLPAATPNGKGSEKDEKDRRELFERKKRKMSEDQDELVKEMPPAKVRRGSGQDATMSGGLAVPEEQVAEAATSKSTESEPIDEPSEIQITIEKSSSPVASSSPFPTPSAAEEKPESKGPPAARIRMVVTSGFYVRSFCHDLGALVSSAALMAELKRTRQGDFVCGKNVLEYSDLERGENVWAPQVEAMLDEWNKSGRTPKPKVKTEEKAEAARDVKAEEKKVDDSTLVSEQQRQTEETDGKQALGERVKEEAKVEA